ncbi:MAG: VacJ family lipoprotein [Kiloniellaceae bacterium]
MARRLIVVLAALVLLAGCATKPISTADASTATGENTFAEVDYDNDPLELLNRFTFSFNWALDVIIFKPAAATYRFLLPEAVRDSIRNALRNLRTPVILANDLLQGKTDRAEVTAVRFVINSTVGVLGLFDAAEDMGYPYHDEDFGQTLAVHGVGEGAYLVLPVLGPSSFRDGVGILVDTFLDPLTYVAQANDAEDALVGRTVTSGIDRRARNIETLEDLERDAIDFYARIRSLYRQTRRNEINDGEVLEETPVPGLYSLDFDLDFEEDQVGRNQ